VTSGFPPALDPAMPGRCHGCRMPPFACFCDAIRPRPAAVRVVVVRHAREIDKTSNSGRLLARALDNAVLVDHGAPGHVLDLSGLLGPDAWVLAPGAAVRPVPPPVQTLVVIDSNWGSARSIRWRVPPLPTLPTLTLPPPLVVPARRVRRTAAPEQMATMEAVAHALDWLGDAETAHYLLDLYDVFALRMRNLRGFDMPAKRLPGRQSIV